MKKILRIAALVLAVTLLTGCDGTSEKQTGTGKVIHVTNETFEELVLDSEKTVLLDFWATWCGPCQQIAPILEEIAQERSDVVICKINVDEEPELAAQFGVTGIPMLVVMEDGQIINEAVGARPKAEIEKLLP
ncbi:MAG: thioredoxin [Oscillospiraceae bacterium]|nr:thioredoxin [Oscillospiraceae bacterium]